MNLATWIDLNRFIDVPAKYRSCLTNNMHQCTSWLAGLMSIAQTLISKYVNKNWKSICLIKKEVFLDQKYVFSVYKFYLPRNQSGYWVYFVSLMCSHIATFGCSHIQLNFLQGGTEFFFLASVSVGTVLCSIIKCFLGLHWNILQWLLVSPN